jgi:hypothetical protein
MMQTALDDVAAAIMLDQSDKTREKLDADAGPSVKRISPPSTWLTLPPSLVSMKLIYR